MIYCVPAPRLRPRRSGCYEYGMVLVPFVFHGHTKKGKMDCGVFAKNLLCHLVPLPVNSRSLHPTLGEHAFPTRGLRDPLPFISLFTEAILLLRRTSSTAHKVDRQARDKEVWLIRYLPIHQNYLSVHRQFTCPFSLDYIRNVEKRDRSSTIG